MTASADAPMLSPAGCLAASRRVGMFTNSPLLLRRQIGRVCPAIPEIFGSRALFSAELGRTEPDPEAFRLLAARLGVAPSEVLFFDDDATNVAGARAAGLSADRVDGAAGVRASVAAHGVDEG